MINISGKICRESRKKISLPVVAGNRPDLLRLW
jgi:hypothetical protein